MDDIRKNRNYQSGAFGVSAKLKRISHQLNLRATPSAAGPFWLLGIAIWGAWCLLFDILGVHFGTSGAPWEAILAPRDHPGGQWKQQDGFEVLDNRILLDFGVILGLVHVSVLGFRMLIFLFDCGCFQVTFLLSISEPDFKRWGLPSRGFRFESSAKIDFSWKSCSMNFGIEVCRFLTALGTFSDFLALRTGLKTQRFLVI